MQPGAALVYPADKHYICAATAVEERMPVQLKVSKWGNSLGLRVPRDIAARAGLSEGARVEMEGFADGRGIGNLDGAACLRRPDRRFGHSAREFRDV